MFSPAFLLQDTSDSSIYDMVFAWLLDNLQIDLAFLQEMGTTCIGTAARSTSGKTGTFTRENAGHRQLLFDRIIHD